MAGVEQGQGAQTIIRPQAGPQTQFLGSPADIAIYGGSAGGGKTWALLMEPLRHVANPQFGAVFFRRTLVQVRNEGGLWDESEKLYPSLNAKPKVAPDLSWTFPSGASVSFAHLEHDKTVSNWQGSQIPLICFDELTHFSAKQFWYLLSRNRSMCGVRPYVRATCNPDADSWVAEFISWWINQDTGLPIPERAGKLRYFVRIGDSIIWADHPSELAEYTAPDENGNRKPIEPKSVTFVPAKLTDNKALMAADPGYLANLMALPTVERERLLGGNWKIRPAAGLLFQRGWCEVVDAIPAGVVKWMRGWDMAATPKTEGTDPDATAGTKVGKLSDGRYIVAHHCNDFLSPSGVERLIRNTAEADGKDVQISLPQDPGQAGKSQVTNLTKLLAGFTVRATPESGDMVTRFSPFSAQAEAGMGNIIAFVRDSLTNMVANIGTSRDKAASTFYSMPMLSDEELLNAYRGAWLPRKIVDIPAFDSVRAWRDWQAKKQQIELIEAEEKRLNVKGKILEAKIKARLWGGAAVVIGTGDQNLTEPLDVERVGKGGLKYLTVMSRRSLTAGEIDRDPASEWYGKPMLYQVSSSGGRQVDIHPSRLVIFNGAAQPDEEIITTAFPGWGDSVLLSVVEAIKQADGTAANIASLVFEAKVNVIRIPDFMQNVGDERYRAKILERYTLAATAKGINGDLLLDKEEEFEQKTASFATLPDVLMSFMQLVSGAADIPATRLLGQSPAGMNATGESDLRNYYDRLQAMQEVEMTPAMMRLDECIIRSGTGSRDPGIYYEWAPLWGMSEKEKADVFKTKADAARQLVGTSPGQEIIPREAVSDALVNALVEDGSLPGLDAAIEEHGKLSEQEPSEDELAAAAVAQSIQER